MERWRERLLSRVGRGVDRHRSFASHRRSITGRRFEVTRRPPAFERADVCNRFGHSQSSIVKSKISRSVGKFGHKQKIDGQLPVME
jgi:hypothetical protein